MHLHLALHCRKQRSQIHTHRLRIASNFGSLDCSKFLSLRMTSVHTAKHLLGSSLQRKIDLQMVCQRLQADHLELQVSYNGKLFQQCSQARNWQLQHGNHSIMILHLHPFSSPTRCRAPCENTICSCLMAPWLLITGFHCASVPQHLSECLRAGSVQDKHGQARVWSGSATQPRV